jgi:hypothetical protein
MVAKWTIWRAMTDDKEAVWRPLALGPARPISRMPMPHLVSGYAREAANHNGAPGWPYLLFSPMQRTPDVAATKVQDSISGSTAR